MNMTSVTTGFKRLSFVLLSLLSFHVVAGGLDQRIDVTASAKIEKSNKIVLHFNLRNLGDTPVEISDVDLPWDAESTALVVYWGRGGLGHTLHKWSMVSDPTPHKTTVAPNTSVSGSLDLNLYFPDLAKMKDYSDIVVFWSYRPPSSDVQPKFGGMLIPSP